jgi:hypothetical protein
MSGHSVALVLAAPGEPATAVNETLRSWVNAGLLEPLLWVRYGATGPSDLVARSLDGTDEVRVLDELARRPIHRVRLLSVHLAVEGSLDTSLLADADRVADIVGGHLSDTIDLERLNLIVPASGVEDLDPVLVADPALKHVLVSPEDRVTDGHVSRFVDWPDGGYAGHAALAVATVSGTWWATGDAAPFDTQQLTASAERSQIAVVRCFARVLRTDELGARVTAEVFRRRRTDAWTSAAVDAVDAPNPVHLVEEVGRQLGHVDGGALRYRSAELIGMPRRRAISILEAFKRMFQFILGRVREVPSELASKVGDRLRRTVEGFAQTITFGQDSVVEVTFGGRGRPVEAEAPSIGAGNQAAQLLRSLGRSTSPPATATLWQVVRRTCFALLDAGPLPDGIDEPRDGAKRLVLGDGVYIVADGDDLFEVNREVLGVAHPLPAWALEPILPWDVVRLKDLRELLAEEHALAEHGGERSSPLSEEPIPVEPDEELAARLEAVLSSLDSYADRQQLNLLWRVGDQLSSSLRTAARSLARSLGVVQRGAPNQEEGKHAKARRQLRLRWILVALAALCWPAGGWYAGDQGWWEPIWPVLVTGAVITWLVGWLIAFLRYQQRLFQIQYEFDRAHRDYLNAIVQAEHDAVETVRLSSLYDQFLDWAAVVSAMIHHPEGHVADPQASDPIAPDDPPFAMRIAEGVPSEETLRRTSAVVGRGVFRRGWLGNLYESYVTEAIRELKHEMGLADDAPDPDPDRDLASPPPRVFVRHRVESGALAGQWHARVRSSVDEALTLLRLGDLFESARALADEELLPAGEPERFLADVLPAATGVPPISRQLWRHEALYSEPERVVRSAVWAPQQFDSSGEVVELRASSLADEVAAGAFVLAVVRCDVSAAAPVSDLALFRTAPIPAETAPATSYTPNAPG